MPDPTPHKPTGKSRAEVAALYSFGNTQEDIAAYLEICVETLVKYYKRELDTALIKANAQVANKLFRKATEGDDLGAMTFWLKTRARWRTVDHEDHNDERVVEELQALRKQLAEQNKKEY